MISSSASSVRCVTSTVLICRLRAALLQKAYPGKYPNA
jgi:hypothetical protein